MKTTLRLLYLRARANWRLLGVVGFGILIAAVLMASTTLYTRSLTDLGLDFDLRRSSGETGTVITTLHGTQLGGDRAQAVRGFAEDTIDANFGELTDLQRVRSITAGAFFIVTESPFIGAFPGAQLVTIEGWESRVRVEGRLPRAPELRMDAELGVPVLAGPLEVAVPRGHTTFTGLAVGDAFPLADAYDGCDREPLQPDGSPAPDEEPCVTTAIVSMQFPAKIVGVFEPTDPEDIFWQGHPIDLTRGRASANPSLLPLAALFLHSEAFDGAVPEILPGYRVVRTSVDPIPVGAFDSVGLTEDLERFTRLDEALITADGSSRSRLEPTLRTFEAERDFSVVPILLILIQVVAIVFFFVVVMARLLVNRETEELILLRGRGASLLQVLGLYTMQLTPIVLLAAALAPLIAAGAISALGFVGAFREVTGSDWIATPLTPQAWALALLGAALAVGAVLIPVAVAAHVRPGAARYVAARPAGATVVQRYHLDIAFLAVAGFLVWAVSARDAVFTRDTVGGLATDPLVLIAPALLGLIAVILVLRLFPVVLRAAAWLARDRLWMPVGAALRQAVRHPGPLARLSLLLLLAATLGTFAASYGGTVDRSFEERARYEAGVDLRAPIDSAAPALLQERLDALPGAGPTALAIRRLGSVTRTGRGLGGQVQVLGVDSGRAASFLWSRDDFSELPLSTLLPPLAPSPSFGGIPLPEDTDSLSLWVKPSVPREDITVWLQLRDADGRFFRTQIGHPELAEWQELRAGLFDSPTAARVRPPISLHGITFTEGQNFRISDPGTLLLDDLSAINADGETTLLDGFEPAVTPWRIQPPTTAAVTDSLDHAGNVDARSGNGAMEFRWGVGPSPGRRGLYLPPPNMCDNDGVCALNVIASTSFLRVHGVGEGDLVPFRLGAFSVDVRIIGTLDFFPTLDPRDQGGFLVADVFDLHHLGHVLNFRTAPNINEGWVTGPTDPGLRARAIAALSELGEAGVIDQRARVATLGEDPLIAAGGSGVLLVSFIAVGILVIVAFLVSVVFTARERMLEMAVLRTLGIGRGSLLAQLILEYLIVALVGLGLGTFLGDRIARLMLRFLEVDEGGDRVLPPFVLVTDWAGVAGAYGVLVGVLTVGVAVAWRLYIRESISRVLRLAV